MTQFEILAGIDWSAQTHQVTVVDADGELLGEREFAHSGDGLVEMADWILGHSPDGKAAAAIEKPHGQIRRQSRKRAPRRGQAEIPFALHQSATSHRPRAREPRVRPSSATALRSQTPMPAPNRRCSFSMTSPP